MEYPFEGDLAAIIEHVTIPRALKESVAEMWAMIGDTFGLPDVSAAGAELDGMVDEIWWAQHMAEKRR